MVQHRTMLKVADNTGAQQLQVIRVRGGYKKGTAGLGDLVNAVVKKAIPHGAVKKSDVVTCVIVRVRKETRRKDGTYVRFEENAGVIVDPKTKDPKGTRIFGPIPRELRSMGFGKIISLAPEVL